MIPIGDNLYLSALPAETPAIPTISVLTPPLSSYHSLTVLPEHHLNIELSDTPDAALLPHLPTSMRFIHRHKNSGVLIHCLHGTSRCVAVALAYRLLTRKTPVWTSPETHSPEIIVQQELNRLYQVYPNATPSPTFVRQLAAVAQRSPYLPYEYAFPPVDGTVLPLEGEELLRLVTQQHGTSCWSLLLKDVDGDSIARCARCRTHLVPRAARLPTPLENGHVRVLPVRWMSRCMVNNVGKLRCTCGSTVGRFDLRPEIAIVSMQHSSLDWQTASAPLISSPSVHVPPSLQDPIADPLE